MVGSPEILREPMTFWPFGVAATGEGAGVAGVVDSGGVGVVAAGEGAGAAGVVDSGELGVVAAGEGAGAVGVVPVPGTGLLG